MSLIYVETKTKRNMTADKYNFKQKAPAIQEILDKAAALPDAEQLAEQVSKMQAVTYAELKALRDGGELVPGMWYRITDYVTIISEDVSELFGEATMRSAGHAYDVVVLALGAGILSENARAMLHDGDEYFADVNLSAWELKYCLDNDTERFRSFASENGKGVVYGMKDEWGNEAYYDFKNVQFKRFTVKTNSQVYASPYALSHYKIVSYFKSLFEGKTNVPQYAGRAPWIHSYYGYRSENTLYEQDDAIWEGGPNPQPGGSRMFVKLYGSEEAEILIEVEKGEWYYTFSRKDTDDATPSDRSLEGSILDASLMRRGRYYAGSGNVFLSSVLNVSISGTDNTFGSINNSTVRGGSVCVANMYSSTLGENDIVLSSSVSNSTIVGDIDYLIASDISRSIIWGSIYRTYIEGNVLDTEICGTISDTWINGVDGCSLSRCEIQNCEIEADHGLKRTSVEGVFNDRTLDFGDPYTDSDESWLLINVNGAPRLVTLSDLF